MEIFGEKYVEQTGSEVTLWRGDLIVLDRPVGDGCRVYMLYSRDSDSRLGLINLIGYKAGARLLSAVLPKQSCEDGAVNLKLSWLQENWDDIIGIESFKTSKFYSWIGPNK